jgi:hypothetical protein
MLPSLPEMALHISEPDPSSHTGAGGAIASALRQKINPDVYRSTNILGADCSLGQFCDVLAEAVRPLLQPCMI